MKFYIKKINKMIFIIIIIITIIIIVMKRQLICALLYNYETIVFKGPKFINGIHFCTLFIAYETRVLTISLAIIKPFY